MPGAVNGSATEVHPSSCDFRHIQVTPIGVVLLVSESIPVMPILDLNARLKSAAEADWTHVVRRCAWGGRVSDSQGRYRLVTVVDPSKVYTDGMCPPCGAEGLMAIRARARRQVELAEAA